MPKPNTKAIAIFDDSISQKAVIKQLGISDEKLRLLRVQGKLKYKTMFGNKGIIYSKTEIVELFKINELAI